MKKIILLLILFFLFLSALPVFSEDSPLNLKEITNNFDSYKDKTVTMKLRLMYVDNVFKKIYFYDKKNYKITFDFSDKEVNKRLSVFFINAHEGMKYFVVFKVLGKGSLGLIVGDLISFKPVVLNLLP